MRDRGGGGDWGRGGRRPSAPPKPAAAPSLAEKVEKIQRSTGVPVDVARQVALGRLDLNEAIKRMAFADEVNGLMTRHGLDRALANQIALGHADLERALRRRRVHARLEADRDRDVLVSAAAAGTELVVGVHGRQLVRVRLTGGT